MDSTNIVEEGVVVRVCGIKGTSGSWPKHILAHVRDILPAVHSDPVVL